MDMELKLLVGTHGRSHSTDVFLYLFVYKTYVVCRVVYTVYVMLNMKAPMTAHVKFRTVQLASFR